MPPPAARRAREMTRFAVLLLLATPVLVERCYRCHSHQSGKHRGGLLLDSGAASFPSTCIW